MPLFPIEQTHLIDPRDVVAVRVRNEYRIESIDFVTEGLLSKVCSAIHKDCLEGIAYNNARTEALIGPIRRGANLAITSNDGNTGARARAQNGHFKDIVGGLQCCVGSQVGFRYSVKEFSVPLADSTPKLR